MSDVKDVRGRYIYVDKFITTIDSSDELDAYSAITVCELIKNEPTADVVEVVRCGDCRFMQYNMPFDGALPKGVDEYECQHWCGSCDPTDYCSYGERREDEQIYLR